MWLSFFFFAGLIIAAGTQLTKNAERISSAAGLSSTWAGALLLPLATSLPELVTSRRAAIIDAPDLAGGNIYGSILFNLVLIALIDLVQGRGPLTARRKRSLVVTAVFSITILTISILGILLSLPYSLGWVGFDTVLILLVYLVGGGMIMSMEGRRPRNNSVLVSKGSFSASGKNEVHRGILYFSLAAAVIVFAGTNLTDSADMIAQQTGLNRTLVGSIFIAVSTSLPELVTTMTAVRLGFVEMAVANVFGANFVNIVVFFFTDLFYRRGPLFMDLDPQNSIIAVMAVILTLVALISLVYPFRRQFLRMGLPSFLIIAGYLLTFVFLYYRN